MTVLFALKECAQPLPIMLNVKRLWARSDYELSDEYFLLPPEEQPIFISGSLQNYEFQADSAKIGGIFSDTIGIDAGSSVGSFTGAAAGVAAGIGAGVAAGTTAGSIFGSLVIGV